MKTAISVPDETFDAVTSRAQELGMSRSEFFTLAARRYLDELDHASLTRRVDDAVRLLGQPDESGAFAAEAGRHRLAAGDHW